MNKLLRYGMAAIGPIGTAGAQFILSLLLLRGLPAREFGGFSFLLVASILATSLWSALFCAPMLVAMSQSVQQTSDEAPIAAIFATSALVSIVAFGFFLLMAIAVDLPGAAALPFAAFAALGLVRWLARAHAYAVGKPFRTMRSDLLYAVTLFAAIAMLFLLGEVTVRNAYLVLLASTAIGLCVFGVDFFRLQIGGFRWRSVKAYRHVWREHSGWSLAGVVSTEATINCHAYLVTAFHGPAAFAPIAATQLLIRPITIATNALMEYERAQLAHAIGVGEIDDAAYSITIFRRALIAVCAIVAAATGLLLWFAPRLIFPARYGMTTLVIGAASWLALALVRSLRTPESALLQAAGEFRPLALASIYSAAFSILTVIIILLFADPLWSIVGVLTGEFAFLYWVWRAAAHWARAAPAATASGQYEG